MTEVHDVGGGLPNLRFQGLDKGDFLRVNDNVLMGYLKRIELALAQRYGSAVSRVEREDLWVLTYCEAGMSSNGDVDPRFQHSLGEIGLFPLPARIRDWTGSDAPNWNRFSSLEMNVFHFLLYVGHLKNRPVKTVAGLTLYKDLFSFAWAKSNPDKQARLTAGVIHGYFYEGNCQDRLVPLDHLIEGYRVGTRLSAMLAPTKFKHAGSSIIVNRGANIERALVAMMI